MNKKLFVLVMVAMLFWSVKMTMAAGFSLTSIGTVTTNSQRISHWWYTGLSPVLSGEAPAGSTVTISIDGTESTTTSDSSGAWTYNPGALTAGDHAIILTNDGSTINFTLTLGSENVDWAAISSGSSESATLPATGVALPTVILLSSGGVLFLAAKKLMA